METQKLIRFETLIEGISQLIIISTATWIHIGKGLGILFYLTLLDSMFVAWAFILNYTFKGERILENKPYRLELSYPVRLLIYFLVFVVEALMNVSFWVPVIREPEYILVVIQFISCPFVFNFLYDKCDVIKVISYHVTRYQKKIVKKFTCMFMASMLNSVCEKSLKMQGNIHYKELYPLVNDPTTFSENCQLLLRSLFISIILKEVKSRSNVITDKILKYIYSYNTGENLKTYKDKESAKRMCIGVFNKRRWTELIKPNNLYAVLYLFENDTDFDLTFIKNEIKFTLIKVITVWSVSNFFNGSRYAIVISLLFMIYREYHKTKIYILFLQILASSIGMYYHSGLISSIISEVVGFCIVYHSCSKTSDSISLFSKKKISNYVSGILSTGYKNKRYTIHIISTIAYTALPKYVDYFEKETVLTMIYAGATFFILINTHDSIQFFTIIYMIVISYLTNCSMVYTIYNGVVLYILINVWEFIKTDKTDYNSSTSMLVSYKQKEETVVGTVGGYEQKPVGSNVRVNNETLLIETLPIERKNSDLIERNLNLRDCIKDDYLN